MRSDPRNSGDFIGWLMGYGVNPDGKGITLRDQAFHVDCHNLTMELKEALRKYIGYLREDKEDLCGQGISSVRWRKGFWHTLKPVHLRNNEWVAIGIQKSIF